MYDINLKQQIFKYDEYKVLQLIYFRENLRMRWPKCKIFTIVLILYGFLIVCHTIIYYIFLHFYLCKDLCSEWHKAY